ncbi:hypothetical protein [Nonomuraea typhae]|uniref:hypothetical protein n=1 Tax=Nonomuraea typhae TaxID=2603600 RepID=UPI0015E22020|nr:hypothetical protein [Nonomuraea typhae]
MSRFVVVADSSCGGCSAIGAALADVLTATVVVRSCRDPHLTQEFPALAGRRPCARPLALHEGRVLTGFRLFWRAGTLVSPGRRAAALRLASRVVRLRVAHLLGTSRPRRR